MTDSFREKATRYYVATLRYVVAQMERRPGREVDRLADEVDNAWRLLSPIEKERADEVLKDSIASRSGELNAMLRFALDGVGADLDKKWDSPQELARPVRGTDTRIFHINNELGELASLGKWSPTEIRRFEALRSELSRIQQEKRDSHSR